MVAMTQSDRQLADFCGRWSVARDICHADGTLARFQGEAIWQWEEDRLNCVETGKLCIAGQDPFSARQEYLWYPDLGVHFADGRYFHHVPPQGGEVFHDCPPDRYEGAYDFTAWPEFRVSWSVTGPRKSYQMCSVYSKS